jgi:hypothetical protein
VFDELEEVAAAIGTREHWPQGWLAVRETIGLDGKRMEVGLADRLRTLAENLAPAGFGERLRTYVLIPAYEIADLAHWETEEDYGQAHPAMVDETRQLGRESGRDSPRPLPISRKPGVSFSTATRPPMMHTGTRSFSAVFSGQLR